MLGTLALLVLIPDSFLIPEFKFTIVEYSSTRSKFRSKPVWTFTGEKWRRQRHRHSRETQCICSRMARFEPICKGYLSTLPFLIRTSQLTSAFIA